MPKITIDVNYGMLAEAARIFDTLTKTSTVNAALEDAVKRRRLEGFSSSSKEDAPAGSRRGPIDVEHVPSWSPAR
ncbi:type II toxin-antitoxin system VapB family antitoxin [Streptomyces sp. NPDC005917]|uniref:type II toxin-antitoxin system VapB family antitoxin n=1 Tax=unclassified Streptomyces TaxID=2593676 RepID=UPI0033C5C2B0